jgi:hypothetical protein
VSVVRIYYVLQPTDPLTTFIHEASPDSSSNLTDLTENEMSHLGCTSPQFSPGEQRRDRETIHTPNIALSSPPVPSSTVGFLQLAPEIRNTIYEKIFETPLAFFIVAAPGTSGQFKLHGKSEQSQYAAIRMLQALGGTSRMVSEEARTFFYASKHFLVLPYGYEYLSVFNRWLEAIGPRCRAVLRNVCFAGYLCLRPCTAPTAQFHNLLRSCSSVRVLTLQLEVEHVYAGYITDLEEYVNQDAYNAPLPRVDLSQWATTAMQMPKIERIKLDIIRSTEFRDRVDSTPDAWIFLRPKNAKTLAADARRRLKEVMNQIDAGRNVVVQVSYVGMDKRAYCGLPW